MSSILWPAFPGQTLSVKRTPLFVTDVQESRSGKEQRISYWSVPRYRWDLTLEFARVGGNTINVLNTSGATLFTGTETAALAWIFSQVRGKWDTLYLNDPIAVQPAYYSGSPLIAAPAMGACAQGVGSLSAGTYYYMVTSVTALGESVQSAEVSQTITGGHGVQLNWTPVANALGYNVYGRSIGGGELFIAYQAGQSSTGYLDGGSITPTGPMPQQKVRFDMDDIEFEQLEDYSRVYSVKAIKMISVK